MQLYVFLLFFHVPFPPGYSPILVFLPVFTPLTDSLVADIYVGDDGKLHKIQGGADSVLPFSSGIDCVECTIEHRGNLGNAYDTSSSVNVENFTKLIVTSKTVHFRIDALKDGVNTVQSAMNEAITTETEFDITEFDTLRFAAFVNIYSQTEYARINYKLCV